MGIEIFATKESKDHSIKPVTGQTNDAYEPHETDLGAVSDQNDASGVYKNGSNDKNKVVLERKDTNKDIQMKKPLNIFYFIAIMIAITGHTSVFITPSAILKTSGSVGSSLIILLIGGLMSMLLALCFSELGTIFPKAGGPYVYVMETFGPLPGFLILWGYVILISGPILAFLSYTAALYIFQPFFSECDAPDTAVKVLAGWILVTCVIINCVYMKYAAKVQILLSCAKVLAMLIIIVSGIANLSNGETDNFETMFEGTTDEPGQFAVAIFYSMFSYGGWQALCNLAEEAKTPKRDLPRTVYISFIAIITKYIMTNVAYFTLLSKADVTTSNAVALVYIQRFYKPLSAVISVLVALTSIGALNAAIMGHSRVIFAGARVGHLPTVFGMIHKKYLTPWPAIFTLLVWGLTMLYTGGVVDMIEFVSLIANIIGTTVVLALLYLRWTKPKEPRPYKTMLFVPVSMLIINISVLVLAIYQKPRNMGIGLIILLAGIPVYWFGVLWNPKPQPFKELIDCFTKMTQKILLIERTSRKPQN